MTRILFVIFDDVTQLDFTGPAAVLSRLPDAEVAYAAPSLRPIRTDAGFEVLPTTTLAEAQSCDLLCVPGGFGIRALVGNASALGHIQRLGGGAAHLTAVCTGSLVLGAAGLLRGVNATTHWAYHDLLGDVGAIPVKARYVRDGRVHTGGGVTAGLDFGLHIAAEIAGETVARTLATAVEYDPAPPFGPGTPDAQPAAIGESLRAFYREPVRLTRQAIRTALAAPTTNA